MKKSNLIRTIILAGSLLLQLSTLCFQSRGAAGDLDLSFDPGSGVNGTVNAVVLQPDGKVIIGGRFTTVKGLEHTNLARLNADGSGDSSFTAGAYVGVSALALQPDGKVLLSNGGLTRLHSDGRLDTNFNVNLCFEDWCAEASLIAVQSDGKVLVGGAGVLRLNSDGSLDSSFTGWGGYVYSMALQPDGKLIVGGYVSNTGYGLLRLNANGSFDNSFDAAAVNGGIFYSIVLQPDGKVLIGGGFIGTNSGSAARLNANGTVDATFGVVTSPIAGGTQGFVHAIALQPDGKVILGGQFVSISGHSRTNLARLNANGSVDLSFQDGVGGVSGQPQSYLGPSVEAIALQTNGKVLIGGAFTRVNGTNRSHLARLNANGSLDGSFNPGAGIEGGGYPLAVQPDGKVLVGGRLITRRNADGSLDSTFNPAITTLGVSFVALQPDGKVLVAGDGITTNGAYFGLITRLNSDGSLDHSFVPADLVTPGHSWNYITAAGFAVQSDGKILVTGVNVTYECDTFGEYCDFYYHPQFVARLNADGSLDNSFNLAAGISEVHSFASQPDGKLLIGVGSYVVNGTNRSGIARLNADGSLDNSFNPAAGISVVYSFALQPDGKVLIVVGSYVVNGTNRFGIARLNANGSLDSSFNPGIGASGVSSVALQGNGKVLIAGGFSTVNGTTRNRIARLNANGSLDASFDPGTGPDGFVFSIALQPDGNVLIGGGFFTVNGVVRPRVARLYGDAVVLPSLNIARSNAFVIISWPVTALNFQLRENTNLSLSNSWSAVTQPAVTNAGQISVTVPTSGARKFFRLQSP